MINLINQKKLTEKIKNDGSCGGYKHCKFRKFDHENEDCKECMEDAYEALEEVNK